MSFKESIERAINDVYSGKNINAIIETLKEIDKVRKKHFEGLPRIKRNHKTSKTEINTTLPRYDKAEPINERDIKISEVCCAEFGCGKILSHSEKLFGNKCVEHQFKRKKLLFNTKL